MQEMLLDFHNNVLYRIQFGHIMEMYKMHTYYTVVNTNQQNGATVNNWPSFKSNELHALKMAIPNIYVILLF